MQNLDINRRIFQALKDEAQKYFNEIREYFNPGTYNAKEITGMIADLATKIGLKEVTRVTSGRRIIDKKDPLVIGGNYNGTQNETTSTALNSEKIITIEVDSFKASFDACKVFTYMTNFAKVNGIKENVFFTKEVKSDETPLISFDIDIQKDAKDLCKYVAKDDLRPQMNQIFISLQYYTLVASDGHILGEKRANISNVEGSGTPQNIFISSESLKKCVGPCKVSYYSDKTIIENGKGEIFINSERANYPNHKSVIPSVYDSKIIPVDYNQIKRFLSSAKKNKYIGRVRLDGVSGNKYITMSVCEDFGDESLRNSIKVELKETINISFSVEYNLNLFLNIGKFESLSMHSHERACLIDLPSGFALIMPLLYNDAYMESDRVLVLHPFYTSSYIPSAFDTIESVQTEQKYKNIEPSKERKEQIIEILESKIESLKQENDKYKDRVRLCRTLYYSNARRNVLNYKRIDACLAAIKVLKSEYFYSKDIDNLYLNCFPECDKTNDIDYQLLTSSASLNTLGWILENVFNKYLPAFKKEVFKCTFNFYYEGVSGHTVFNINNKLASFAVGIQVKQNAIAVPEKNKSGSVSLSVENIQDQHQNAYIDTICVLLAINTYIAKRRGFLEANTTSDTEINNNFDCVPGVSDNRLKRNYLYDARSG